MKKTLVAILTGLTCCCGASTAAGQWSDDPSYKYFNLKLQEESFTNYSPYAHTTTPPGAPLDLSTNKTTSVETRSPLRDLEDGWNPTKWEIIPHDYLVIEKAIAINNNDIQRYFKITNPLTGDIVEFIDFGGTYNIEWRGQFYNMSFNDRTINDDTTNKTTAKNIGDIIGYKATLHVKFLPSMSHFAIEGARKDTKPEWIYNFKIANGIDGPEYVEGERGHRTKMDKLYKDIVDDGIENVFQSTRLLLDIAKIHFNAF